MQHPHVQFHNKRNNRDQSWTSLALKYLLTIIQCQLPDLNLTYYKS